MKKYKMEALREGLTRHILYETISELFIATDIYKKNGFDVKTYILMGEDWEALDI